MIDRMESVSSMSRPDTGRPHLSIVIPVYNERKTIEEILWRVQSLQID